MPIYYHLRAENSTLPQANIMRNLNAFWSNDIICGLINYMNHPVFYPATSNTASLSQVINKPLQHLILKMTLTLDMTDICLNKNPQGYKAVFKNSGATYIHMGVADSKLK